MLSTEPVFIRPVRAVAGSGAGAGVGQMGRQREMSGVDPNAEVNHVYVYMCNKIYVLF